MKRSFVTLASQLTEGVVYEGRNYSFDLHNDLFLKEKGL